MHPEVPVWIKGTWKLRKFSLRSRSCAFKNLQALLCMNRSFRGHIQHTWRTKKIKTGDENKWIGSEKKRGKMERNTGRKKFVREENLCSCGGRSGTLHSPECCCSLGCVCWALYISACKKQRREREAWLQGCNNQTIHFCLEKLWEKKVIGYIELFGEKPNKNETDFEMKGNLQKTLPVK